jgi:hypothetical protein
MATNDFMRLRGLCADAYQDILEEQRATQRSRYFISELRGSLGNGAVRAHTNIAELDDGAADGTVAFCGTKTLEAWLHNLDVRVVNVAQAGVDTRLTEGGEHRNDALKALCFAVGKGTAHLGFVAGALAAMPDLWPRFCRWLKHECDGNNKRRTLWVTGHSFGGAVAMVFAAMAHGKAQDLGIEIDVRVVTFGAPRVFDGEAAKGLIDGEVGLASIDRFYTTAQQFPFVRDPVTLLPPGLVDVGTARQVPVVLDVQSLDAESLFSEATALQLAALHGIASYAGCGADSPRASTMFDTLSTVAKALFFGADEATIVKDFAALNELLTPGGDGAWSIAPAREAAQRVRWLEGKVNAVLPESCTDAAIARSDLRAAYDGALHTARTTAQLQQVAFLAAEVVAVGRIVKDLHGEYQQFVTNRADLDAVRAQLTGLEERVSQAAQHPDPEKIRAVKDELGAVGAALDRIELNINGQILRVEMLRNEALQHAAANAVLASVSAFKSLRSSRPDATINALTALIAAHAVVATAAAAAAAGAEELRRQLLEQLREVMDCRAKYDALRDRLNQM